MAETETRGLQVSRRDRDVEIHVVINAVVNKLTYSILSLLLTRVRLFHRVFWTFVYLIALIVYRQFLCHYSLLVLEDGKHQLYHSLLLKVIMLHKY